MRKIFTLLFLMLFAITGSFAQTHLYSFAQSNETYTAITGGTVVTSATDNVPTLDSYVSSQITLPVAFTFAGTSYTSMYVTSNGQIQLGGTAGPSTTQYKVLSTNTGNNVFLAPFSADLGVGATGAATIRWEQVGDEIVIQWSNFRRWAKVESFSFQARLNTTNGVIKFVYNGTPPYATSTDYQPQVGIKNSTASYKGLTVGTSGNWNTPAQITTGISDSSIATFNGAIGFTSGLTYTFTPPVQCNATPVAGTISGALIRYICSGSAPGVISVTGATDVYPGISYQWEQSVNNGTDWANAVGGTGATTTSYTPPSYAGTPIQYRLRVTCANGGETVVSDVLSVNNRIAPTTQATALTAAPANISLTSFGLSWTSGNGDRRQVYVSTTPITDPVDGTGVTITANAAFANTGQQLVYDGTGSSVTVTGLTCGTQYYVKVFEYNRCGSGPYNTLYLVPGATNAITVTTGIPATAPALPVTNNFPGLTDTNLSTIAPGWYEAVGTTTSSFIPVVGNSNWTGSTALTTPTAKVNLYDNDFNVWIISPKMAITANSRLKFKAAITDYNLGSPDATRMTGTDDKVNVLVSTDGCGAVWTVIHTFNAANTTTLTNVLTDFTLPLNYTGQTIQIAFQGVDGPLDELPDYDFHIGNIVVELVPQCDVPVVAATANITKNSATISWAAPSTGTPTGYQYVVSTTSTAPAGAGIDVAGTVTSVNVTPLLPSTTYYVFVRTACGGDFSSWTVAQTFTTMCDYPELLTTTPDSVCGIGSAELQATTTPGAVVNWFTSQTGGAVAGTGTTFTTPVLTATTNYYANAGTVIPNTTVNFGTGNSTSSSAGNSPYYHGYGGVKTQYIIKASELTTAGLYAGPISSVGFTITTLGTTTFNSFAISMGTTTQNVATNTHIDGLTPVYSNAAQTLTAGLNTYTFPTPFMWDGTSNIVVQICYSNVNSGGTSSEVQYYDPGFTGTTYTYADNKSAALICSAVTGSVDGSGGTTTGTGRPKMVINGTGICSGPRTLVAATVTAAPAITATVNDNVICLGESVNLSVTSANAGYAYTWMPGNLTGAAQTVSPTANTTYTVTATDTTTGCVTTATVSVTVNALPTPITVSSTPIEVCVNEVQALTAAGANIAANATLGTGTTAPEQGEYPNPFSAWYGGVKTQIIYKAAELQAQGLIPGSTITSIAFEFQASVAGACNDLRIKMGPTTNANMSGGFVPNSTLTTVYNATWTPTANATGYVPFTLTTPYIWTGGDIMIEVTHNAGNGGNGWGTRTRTTATSYQSVYSGAKDSVTPAGSVGFDAVTAFSVSGASANRPNTRFAYSYATNVTWLPVTNLYTNAAATTPYTAGTNASTVYYKSTAVAAATVYTATATNAADCSVTANATVSTTVPNAPTAAATQTICNAGTVASLQTTSGTGILWYADATGGTALTSTTALVDGEDYFASQTIDGCESIERAEVTVEINVTAAPTVDETTQTFCHAATVADLDANGDNIVWYSDPTATDAQLDPADALEDGTSYFASQTIDGCESATRTEVAVVITSTPAPTVDEATQTFCHAGTVAGLQANGDGILWYATADGETPLTETDALENGTYYGSQTADGCESIERVEVTVVINVTPAPTVDNATQSFCNAATVANLEANGDNNVLWYASADAETPLAETDVLVDGTIYYGAQTIDGCESIERVEVTVEINVVPAPEGDDEQMIEIVTPEDATIEDIQVDTIEGGIVTWYPTEEDAIAGTNAIEAGTQLESETTYYATQTIGSCTSVEIFAVTVTITLDNKEFNSAAFTYYPNPVRDILTLAYSQDISNVTVYNMIGQPVMTQQINAVEGRINMSNLADGTYMVNVTFGNTVKTIRVIKKQ